MKRRGLLIIVSGPSGAGKGTIVERLVDEKGYFLSISATTRAPRPNEKDAVHYFFKSVEEFKKLEEDGELLENACFCGNYYGTPKAYVDSMIEDGKNVILEIEVQGALQVKKIYPESVLIFTMPPNVSELRRRLFNRGTETEQIIDKRIERAMQELEYLDKYDYVVINDNLSEAVNDVNNIVFAESMKAQRNLHLKQKFKGEI